MHAPMKTTGLTTAELLMNVASTLVVLTKNLDLCQQIPAYLCRALSLEPLTLAVVKEAGLSSDSSLFLFASSAAVSAGSSDSSLRANVLNVYNQTKSPTMAEGPALRSGFDQPRNSATLSDLPRTTVFSHKIDADYRMLLVVHQRAESAPIDAVQTEQLELVARQLGKLLGCLVAWHTRPESLGSAFEKITTREWAVVRGLATDLGEKQLADQLQVSPHTLHSHVKSVYRRLGVQGRLSVIKRVEQAMRATRMERINEGMAAFRNMEPALAVAAG